jgi:YesN/AraC family two-component response regulator
MEAQKTIIEEQLRLIHNEQLVIVTENNQKKVPLTELHIDEWCDKIDHYLTTIKPYWDAHFDSATISKELHFNRTYLSIVINNKKQQRFQNYINKLRIADLQALIMSELVNSRPKFTLEYYAHKVGFRSRSAFNKAFKYNTGLTPTRFLSQLVNSK